MKNDERKKAEFKVQDREKGLWMLTNVRLSFPNLWEPGMYDGAKKPRLDSSFLIAKEDKEVAIAISKEMVAMAQRENSKITKLSQLKHPKLEKTKEGDYILKTSNALDYPAVYFNRQGKPVKDPLAAGADRELYAGCHVRVKITVNSELVDSKKGIVKLWTNLTAIQFLAHGERFGNGPTEEELSEGFGEVEVDDDEFENKGLSDDDFEDSDEDDFDDDELDLDDDDF